MSYRDDLAAATAHAAALERELSEARAARAADARRIAELEEKLAIALRRLGEKRVEPNPPVGRLRAWPLTAWAATGVLALGAISGAVLCVSSRKEPVPAPRSASGLPVIDIVREANEARALASRQMGGLKLCSIDAEGVDEPGLLLRGRLVFRFTSPTIVQQNAEAPLDGWEDDQIDVIYQDGVPTRTEKRWRYCEPLAHAPRCSARAVWQEAMRRGAPRRRRAHLELAMRGPHDQLAQEWRFSIVDGDRALIDLFLPDDCP